jgi:hypothetical protein
MVLMYVDEGGDRRMPDWKETELIEAGEARGEAG